MASATDLRPGVDLDVQACGPVGQAGPDNGVTPQCWRDGSWATGRYHSKRWYGVRLPDGREGFVHSSVVDGQVRAPDCSDLVRHRAADWAIMQAGRAYADEATKAAYPDWAPGPRGEWSGDGAKFSHRAYALNGISVPRGSAIRQWHAYQRQGRTGRGLPPRGALVFWNATSAGHVAVAVGGTTAVGARGSQHEGLSVEPHDLAAYPNYLGWVLP